jgi:ATP-binding cassette subfamily B multidrug efflux pump
MRDKIKWFWKYYRRYPYVLAVLLILTPVQTVFQVYIPRFIEFIIDYARTGVISANYVAIKAAELGRAMGLSTAASFALTLIALGFISFLLYAYVQAHRGWMNLKLEWLFRQDAFSGITGKGPDFFNRFRTGDLVTRMTDDVAEKLSWFACSGIFRLYEAVLMVGFTVAMMISINPLLTLWTAGPLPILIIIFFKSSSALDRRYDILQKRISSFNDVMEACFSGIRVVKAYARENAQKGKFRDAALDRRTAEISAVKVTTVVDSLYGYIWQFGIIIALMAGGYLVIGANLTLGKLVAFIYYVVNLVFPMFDIGQFLVKSRQSGISIDRLTELEKVPRLVEDKGLIRMAGEVRGDLRFENVDLLLPGADRKIVDNVSFEIDSGLTVALVGKIGSGKTWIINMIPRLVDPTGGVIRLDGRDLREFRLEDLRRSIGYVPQEPVLFSDTVANNIRFGRQEITDDILRWALDISRLDKEVGSFPDGMDTLIGTRGVAISGGQKQRLALARALVGRPKILILDDCTSALDSRTEAELWEKLHGVLPGITALVITHRPDTLERVDRIFVVDRGCIAESGSHSELMRKEGIYSRIYRRYQLEEQVK